MSGRRAAQIKRFRQIENNEGLGREIILRRPRVMTIYRMLIGNQGSKASTMIGLIFILAPC